MLQRVRLALLVSCLAGSAVAAPAKPAPAKQVPKPAEQGMVIRGDQEAPLVLYIVPWQEGAVQQLPEAPRYPLIPVALDHERSLVSDPAERPVGAAGGRRP